MRFFSVFSIARPNQKERISKPSDGMILKSKGPAQAAKKAMTKLCKKIKNKKKLHGRCALRITMIELEGNESGDNAKRKNGKVVFRKTSKGAVKMKSYRLQLKKLSPPVVVMRGGKKVTYRHKPVVTSYLNKKASKAAIKRAMSAPQVSSKKVSPPKKRKPKSA